MLHLREELTRVLAGWALCSLGIVVSGTATALTYTVSSGDNAGTGTFRAAITSANGARGPHTIQFNERVIVTLSTALPALTQSQVTIEGANCVLDGNGLPSGAVGLQLSGGNNVVRNLTFRGFPWTKILITGSGNTVSGCKIGNTGNAAADRGGEGIVIEGSNNVIGGTAEGAGNVISACTRNGVVISGSGASGNQILGNKIGINAAGTAALGNGMNGIRVDGAPDTIIGSGDSRTAGNVISANAQNGILVTGSGASGTLVQGNIVGLDAAGAAGLGNGERGIQFYGAGGATIGGDEDALGNVVSANAQTGIVILSCDSDITIASNRVGTNEAGTASLGNLEHGVLLSDATNVEVLGNLISGNNEKGVLIISESQDNVLAGNLIGTELNGLNALPNNSGGLAVQLNSADNLIGGAEVTSGNIIAFNAGFGILVEGGGSTGNQISHNSIFSNVGPGSCWRPAAMRTWPDRRSRRSRRSVVLHRLTAWSKFLRTLRTKDGGFWLRRRRRPRVISALIFRCWRGRDPS